MFTPPPTAPCTGYPVAVLFPDVEPEVLAREVAHEASRAERPGAESSYPRRALLALERRAAGEMAQTLLAAGTGIPASRAHAERMRRHAIAAGAIHRARFWADVTEALAHAGNGERTRR